MTRRWIAFAMVSALMMGTAAAQERPDAFPTSSLLKKLARAKGVVIHFPGVILREGEDARTVPGSGRPFLVHPAGGADSRGSSAARDTQARSRGLEGAEP